LWGWPGVTPAHLSQLRRRHHQHRPKHVPAFPAAGIDVKGLAGKRVRVRGWIEWRSGPMIAVTHPEQLELLPDAPESGDAKPAPPPQTAPGL